jgi:hypothetical protein
MKLRAMLTSVLGALLALAGPPRRDERGLSQSAETAILLAGAVVVAGIVVTVITAFVKAKLPK